MFIGDALESNDNVKQNLRIEVDEIKVSKHGSIADIGPVGFGHYYRIEDNFDVKIYNASPKQILRLDTFGGGFIFFDRYRDGVNRRQVFIRADLKESSVIPNLISSNWLNSIGNNGIIDIKFFSYDTNAIDDAHTIINSYSFNGYSAPLGDVMVYYNDISTSGKLTGHNYYLNLWVGETFYSNELIFVTSEQISIAEQTVKNGNTLEYQNDPRFIIPPPAKVE
jgi:hypothetical protein